MGDSLSAWGQSFQQRIERRLALTIEKSVGVDCPPRLGAALKYAVFPGGARIRPILCLAVAKACGDRQPLVADSTAAALELLHCASLIHDDLPCFDDAVRRRGKPALHRVFGESLTVLVGDALIVLAFKTLAEVDPGHIDRLITIWRRVCQSLDTLQGIVAGQAWEMEKGVDLAHYHNCKTGSLFEAATVCGALASDCDGEPWKILGRKLGQAYQIADDIADILTDQETADQQSGQDALLGRPNVALEIGVTDAIAQVQRLLDEGLRAIPQPFAATGLVQWLRHTAVTLLESKLGMPLRVDGISSHSLAGD